MLKLYKRYPLTYCSARKACCNKVDIKVRNTKRTYLKDNLKKNEQTQNKCGDKCLPKLSTEYQQ